LVEHILLLRVTEQATPEAIGRALDGLRGLKDKIPGIVEVTCGPNFSDRAKGYTHAMVMRFQDRASLQAYGPHPEHQRVVQDLINPIRAEVLVVDYES
jgi:hypothetical protein